MQDNPTVPELPPRNGSRPGATGSLPPIDESAPLSRAEAAVIGATRAVGWLTRTSWRVTLSLPGGELAERQLVRLERAVVSEVRRRLADADTTTPGFAWRAPATTTRQVGDHEVVTLIRPLNGHTEPLRAGMAELLNRSANTDTRHAREHLYAAILRQLVPDEARMLATLADGAPRAGLDVVAKGPLGGAHRVLLATASTVGRDAGVAVPEHVPAQVSRLRRFGLVEVADENPQLAEDYVILAHDPVVVRAAESAKRTGLVRRTVTISVLGKEFWTACDPRGD